ncbi:MAG: glycosyltransferase [Thaumarchaeota archaeon]|nr:glycosyltransferase [Nitrososphaerota archaeon]
MRVGLLFDREARFPPTFDNIKGYYVSKEIMRRGIGVSWIQLGKENSISRRDGILFATLRVPAVGVGAALLSAARIFVYCLRSGVRLVYIDEWLFFRHSPIRRVPIELVLRVAGIKVVLDQRDPYTDFEIAEGRMIEGTTEQRLSAIEERAMVSLSNLLILPSEAYARRLVGEGFSVKKTAGYFRGVDTERFSSDVDGSQIRHRLGLEGKFVVGWFGIMQPHRLIKEVLVPLAKEIGSLVPRGYAIIGGKGPLQGEFVRLRKEFPEAACAYLGLVPYEELPKYLAACDVLLCPSSTKSRFSRHSAWLKITEALAVGKPVIATRTETSDLDFKNLRGVVWTGSSLKEFENSIKLAYETWESLSSDARDQALRMGEFDIKSRIPPIVDRVLETLR